jgi:hypothetical protein
MTRHGPHIPSFDEDWWCFFEDDLPVGVVPALETALADAGLARWMIDACGFREMPSREYLVIELVTKGHDRLALRFDPTDFADHAAHPGDDWSQPWPEVVSRIVALAVATATDHRAGAVDWITLRP